MDIEVQLLEAWQNLATPWTRLIADDALESRTLATNNAIVEAVLGHHPQRVLDIGCGEGWLCRALAARGIAVTGTDGAGELVATARSMAGEDPLQTYHHLNYGELDQVAAGFDVAVCNFSLLGNQSTAAVVSAATRLLKPRGRLLIQTLHPLSQADYVDGWREEHWEGFGEAFSAPTPWFFRTLSGWFALLAEHNFTVETIAEPRHPLSGQCLSIIFDASRE